MSSGISEAMRQKVAEAIMESQGNTIGDYEDMDGARESYLEDADAAISALLASGEVAVRGNDQPVDSSRLAEDCLMRFDFDPDFSEGLKQWYRMAQHILDYLQPHLSPKREIVDVQVGEFAIREFQATMGFDAYRMACACAEAWGLLPGNVRQTSTTDVEGQEPNP